MGHSNINLAMVIAGFFTMGAAFVAGEQNAHATIELAPVIIYSDGPCSEYTLDPATMIMTCEADGEETDVTEEGDL